MLSLADVKRFLQRSLQNANIHSSFQLLINRNLVQVQLCLSIKLKMFRTGCILQRDFGGIQHFGKTRLVISILKCRYRSPLCIQDQHLSLKISEHSMFPCNECLKFSKMGVCSQNKLQIILIHVSFSQWEKWLSSTRSLPHISKYIHIFEYS